MKLHILCLALVLLSPASQAATVTIQGAQTNQVIDGFGVNANHRSWNNDELKPVLDALIDQAGMTLFRVIYDNTDWEAANDNSDPNVMNWAYYAPIYQSTEFTRLWNLASYLNYRGITNGLIFNFQGPGPSWLGGSNLTVGLEPEWAEMIASLLVWARYTNGLQFQYVAPNNEPDQYPQGIHCSNAAQYVNSLHKLAQLLDNNGMSDVQFFAPDLAYTDTAYMQTLMNDPVVMAKLKFFGVHTYATGGGGSAGVSSFIQSSPYPDRRFWITEFNALCSVCDYGQRGTYDWTYCKLTVQNLFAHLLNNASAGIVWEAYDSYYYIPNNSPTGNWSYWGLFSIDDINAPVKTYTPRKNFYTMAQISKWVRPGAQRINISGTTSPFTPLLAFKHTGLGQITIVGINTSTSAATLSATLASLPSVTHLDLYYTSATTNLAQGNSVAVNNGTFSTSIPADCVFTLTGSTGVNVAITNPVNGAQFNAPATIPIAATATTTAGSIALVGFYNGSALLGDAILAPYGFTWANVPMGDYSLTALAGDSLGNVSTSAVVNVSVIGAIAQINVTPPNATLPTGATQRFSATGTDLLGHTLNPQPAYAWSVTGGGTIDGTGLFTAGGLPGGPFNVVAGSGGLFGTGTISLTAITGGTTNGGTIGNTNEGTTADNLWDNGAWINANRVRATNNLVVTTIFAKVGAIPGKYKCAVYTDNNGLPNRLLLGSGEVSNPAGGWQSFPLASSVTLTNGSYYWLAVWSDNTTARVYYSGSNGTLRWGQYNYGSWPDPISTSGGSSFNYCIYASGAAAPTLTSLSVTPANPSIPVGGTQQFTATGNYSDGSAQIITSQATWISSNAVVATIINSGLATGASAGAAIISARLGAVTGSSTLLVQPAALISIAVTPASSSILVGAAWQFTATATYADGSTQNVTSQAAWISTNALVAAISANGLATAASAGATTISATLAGVTGNALLAVQAPPVLTSIAVAPTNSSIVVGGTQQFTATATYADGSTQDITSQAIWISTNAVVADIGTNGLATADSAGTTPISATLAGVTGNALLTVQAPPTLALIAVTPANPSILIGAAQQFVAIGTYSDGSTLNISSLAAWISSNAVVAAVSANGLASGVSAGATTISATLAGVTGNALLAVQAPPSLTLIAVTPANPSIMIGAAQQFTATGTYSDGSTQNITSQAAWISSNAVVAGVNSSGLASGVSAGTAILSATLGGNTGSTVLTVQALPLTIITATLSGGTVNAAYSATLAASGGTTPYRWSLASGLLPAGLTLNTNNGVISGTPTAAGAFSISVQASDAGNPVQVVARPLSLAIAAASSTVTIWSSNTVPGMVDGGPDSSVELGVKFRSDTGGSVTGIRFYKAAANTGTHVANLWTSTGTRLATATFTGESASGWQQVNFASPVTISSNTVYVVSYHASNGHYSAGINFFSAAGVDNPPLHALRNGVSGGNGVYAYGKSSAFPTLTWNTANYWVDLVFKPLAP